MCNSESCSSVSSFSFSLRYSIILPLTVFISSSPSPSPSFPSITSSRPLQFNLGTIDGLCALPLFSPPSSSFFFGATVRVVEILGAIWGASGDRNLPVICPVNSPVPNPISPAVLLLDPDWGDETRPHNARDPFSFSFRSYFYGEKNGDKDRDSAKLTFRKIVYYRFNSIKSKSIKERKGSIIRNYLCTNISAIL